MKTKTKKTEQPPKNKEPWYKRIHTSPYFLIIVSLFVAGLVFFFQNKFKNSGTTPDKGNEGSSSNVGKQNPEIIGKKSTEEKLKIQEEAKEIIFKEKLKEFLGRLNLLVSAFEAEINSKTNEDFFKNRNNFTTEKFLMETADDILKDLIKENNYEIKENSAIEKIQKVHLEIFKKLEYYISNDFLRERIAGNVEMNNSISEWKNKLEKIKNKVDIDNKSIAFLLSSESNFD